MAHAIASLALLISIVSLYCSWATSEASKKNEAVNYTIEKLTKIESNIECGTDDATTVRNLMSFIEQLRPSSVKASPLPAPGCKVAPPRSTIELPPGTYRSGPPTAPPAPPRTIPGGVAISDLPSIASAPAARRKPETLKRANEQNTCG